MLPPQSWHAASTLISYRELPVIKLQQNHGRSSLSFLLEDSDWSSFTPVHWKQCTWELFQADLPGFCNLCEGQVVICSSSPTRASLHRSFMENQANPSSDKLPQPARERCHPTLAGNGCLFILARSLLILLSRFRVSWKKETQKLVGLFFVFVFSSTPAAGLCTNFTSDQWATFPIPIFFFAE